MIYITITILLLMITSATYQSKKIKKLKQSIEQLENNNRVLAEDTRLIQNRLPALPVLGPYRSPSNTDGNIFDAQFEFEDDKRHCIDCRFLDKNNYVNANSKMKVWACLAVLEKNSNPAECYFLNKNNDCKYYEEKK